MIELSKIRTDGGTQARAEIHDDTVAEYAEAMEDENTVFPPCIVYYDGKNYWLADGFHRVAAWKRAGRVEVPAEVRQGDRRRAILHSVAANSTHGLRRSNADKRRAVMTLLEDDEWSQWSNREIARKCAVSEAMVRNLRGPICEKNADSSTRKVERGGVTYEQNTSNIGKAQPVDEPGETEQGQPATPGDQPAGQPETADPQPETEDRQPEPDPYGYAKLNADALLDTANGLRADLDDARAKVKALKAEIEDLKSANAELSESSDLGPAVSKLRKQISTVKGTRDDAIADKARLQRQVNAQKKEIEQLRKSLADQELTL